MSQSKNGADAPKQKSRRGCLLLAFLFVGVPCLLLFVGILLLVGRERSARRQLQERISQRQSAGLPFDNASLSDYHARLSSDQDTPAWLEVLDEVSGADFNSTTTGVPIFDGNVQSEVPVDAQPWAEERVARAFLQRWKSLHERIQQLSLKQLDAGAKPVHFPIKFSSIDTLLPNTQNMRQAARLLKLQGDVELLDRDSTALRLSIESLFGCSQTLAGEPILVSNLVVIAIDGMAIRLLRDAVEQNALEEADLQALLPRVLARTSIQPGWRQSMQGEIGMMLPVFRDPAMAKSFEGPAMLPGRSRDALYYLDLIEGTLELPEEDLAEFLQWVRSRDEELPKLLEGGLLVRFDSILTTLAAPAIASAGSAFVRQAAQNRLAAISIGIRLFEKRNGRLPVDLSELETVGLDPAQFVSPGGDSFGYQAGAEAAIVWGFDLLSEDSVPAAPPQVDLGEPNSELRRMWIWRLEIQPGQP